MFLGRDPKEDIAYIFEESPKWELKLHALWLQLRKHYRKEYRMGTLTFSPKGKFRPLDAADRLAYETWRHLKEPNVQRSEWKRLTENPHQHHGKYCSTFDLESLPDYIKTTLPAAGVAS
jgi:hypothetical protein